jgi:hypothetical protein
MEDGLNEAEMQKYDEHVRKYQKFMRYMVNHELANDPISDKFRRIANGTTISELFIEMYRRRQKYKKR